MTGGSWRLLTNDGAALHVEAQGRSGAAAVLLLNGITMSTEGWNGLGRLLERRRPVVRYDMRGQGASDAPAGPYLRARHARDLLALLTDLHARGLTPVHLVGLSNGGYVAQLLLAWLLDEELARAAGLTAAELGELAALHAQLQSLTLLDTFYAADARMRAAVASWLSALTLGGAAARFDAATPWVWGPEFLQNNAAALADAREQAALQPQEAVRALLEGLLLSAADEPDLAPTLKLFRLPLLVALGQDDVLTPYRNHRQLLEVFGRDPANVKLIPNAAHAAPVENPAAVERLLSPFLSTAEADTM